MMKKGGFGHGMVVGVRQAGLWISEIVVEWEIGIVGVQPTNPQLCDVIMSIWSQTF